MCQTIHITLACVGFLAMAYLGLHIGKKGEVPLKEHNVGTAAGWGDENAVNYMDIYQGWNIALRLYEPEQAYFSGEWVRPELEIVE